MEKSLGSQGTGVSLWVRNGTVNVWDRSGHQWAFPAISELATLFPWRAVKAESEGRRVICKYPLHLCGLANQQIYPKDGQCEQGCRSSWLIQHSAQPTKHKYNDQSCHWLHRGMSHSKKQSCSRCVDWQPKETLDIFLRQQATVIKMGSFSSHAGDPQEPCVCSGEEGRGQSGLLGCLITAANSLTIWWVQHWWIWKVCPDLFT